MRFRGTVAGLALGLSFAVGTAFGVTSIPYISGTLTNGHCVQVGTDALSIADAGGACASTSGFAALATAQVFTKAQGVTPVALTSTSNSSAVDASLSNIFTATLTENTTIANPTNLVAGKTYTFVVTQATGSHYTVAWGSDWKWPAAAAPTVTATDAAVDMMTCVAISSSVCLFGAAQQSIH